MKLSDITIVVGVDANTIQQLAVSLPTWRKNRPELWEMPWLLFYDRECDPDDDAADEIHELLPIQEEEYIAWPPGHAEVIYETQREKMVSGHCLVPAIYAKTPWSLKIDTDALALDSRPWLKDEWFKPDADGRHNAIVASPWGYTRPKGGGGTVQEWAEKLEVWGDRIIGAKDRLGLSAAIRGSKIVHPRIASWLSFYHVPWLQLLAAELGRTLPPYRLPVPSQDTTAFYFAARRGDRICRTNQKRFGWTNVPRLGDLKAKAAEVMGR